MPSPTVAAVSVVAALAEFGLYVATVLTYYLGDVAILGGVNPLQFDEGTAILLSSIHLITWLGSITAEFVVNQEFFVAMVVVGYFIALVADGWSMYARFAAATLPAGALVRLVISAVLGGMSVFQMVVNGMRAREQRSMVRRFMRTFGETNVVVPPPREAGNKRLMQQLYRAKRLSKTTVLWIRRLFRYHAVANLLLLTLTLAFLFGFYPSFGVRIAPVLLFVGHICITPFEIAVSRAAVGPAYPPPIVRGTPGLTMTSVFYPLLLSADVLGIVFHVVLSILTFGTSADIGLIAAVIRVVPWIWLAFMLFLLLSGARSARAAFIVQKRLRRQGQLQIRTPWAD